MITYQEAEQYLFPDLWRDRRSFPQIRGARTMYLEPTQTLLLDDRVDLVVTGNGIDGLPILTPGDHTVFDLIRA